MDDAMLKEARKARRYVQRVRSDLNLLQKSDNATAVDVLRAKNLAHYYLVYRDFKYPPRFKLFGMAENMTFHERKQVLGIQPYEPEFDPNVETFDSYMARLGDAGRRNEWIWRAGQQAREMNKEGWYPFFVTLTIDPKKYADRAYVWRETRALEHWLNKLGKLSAQASGFGLKFYRNHSRHLFIKHMGQVEHGSSGEHHHMHLLIWMRNIPNRWKQDPNYGLPYVRRTRQKCLPAESLWPHGFSDFRYFRHEGDIWHRQHGFVLPCKPDGKAINIHHVERAGNYIGKYIGKEGKAWNYRVKATRNLGMSRLQTFLMECHLNTVKNLAMRPPSYNISHSASTIHTVPSGLLRREATSMLFYRRWASKALDIKEELTKNSDAYKEMLESVRNGAQPSRMSFAELYDWVGQHLPAPSGYCDKKYMRAVGNLAVEFPRETLTPSKHIGIPNGTASSL